MEFFQYPHNLVPQNHVHWSQTPDSHIFSANLPGVRKEEVRLEVEDSKYLIIRTEATGESTSAPERAFRRKFRLPSRVDIEGITARCEDGVLTITVPRAIRRPGFFVDPNDVPERLHTLARAA